MHRLRRSSSIDGEQGSAIILALIVLTVIGTITAASLSYLQTSFMATNERNATGAQVGDIGGRRDADRDRVPPRAPRGRAQPRPHLPGRRLTFPGDAGTVTVDVCPESGSLVPTNTPLAKLLTIGAKAAETDITTERARRPRRLRRHVLERGDHAPNGASRLVVHEGRVWARQGLHRNDRRRHRVRTAEVQTHGRGAGRRRRSRVHARGRGEARRRVSVRARPAWPRSGPAPTRLAQLQNAIGACTTVWLQARRLLPQLRRDRVERDGPQDHRRHSVAGPLPAAPFPGGCNPAAAGTQLVFGGASQMALVRRIDPRPMRPRHRRRHGDGEARTHAVSPPQSAA